MGLHLFYFRLRGILLKRKSVFLDYPVSMDPGVVFSTENGGIIRVGEKSFLKGQVKLFADTGELIIGKRVHVGFFSIIAAKERVEIGDDALIAEHVSVRDSQHRYDQYPLPVAEQGFDVAPVKIGKSVWVGTKVTILPGVEIGDYAIIGAGSVVTHSIPSGKIAVGVPARVVKSVPGIGV